MLELEALTIFLATRATLWTTEAAAMGADPEAIVRKMAANYAGMMKKKVAESNVLG